MKTMMLMGIFSLFSLFASCKAYTDLSVDAFDSRLSGDGTAQLVDVRTADEFAEGHLPGALSLDVNDTDFLGKAQALLAKDRPVLVYCRSGRRSAAAAARLAGEGFAVFNLEGGILAWKEAGRRVTAYEGERFCTPGGLPVEITLIKHASLEIRYRGLSIQVDPVTELGVRTDYAADFPKADIILVTHEHGDHFDRAALATLRKEDTRLITNERCAGMAGWGTPLANGGSLPLADDIYVEAVPAYNTTEGRQQFHPKGRDNGYILTLGGLRIYLAGDTEDIPEMADITGIDIAFLPCNQPYTMTVDQLVNAAGMIRPGVLIPYHFSATDIRSIPERLPEVDVRLHPAMS